MDYPKHFGIVTMQQASFHNLVPQNNHFVFISFAIFDENANNMKEIIKSRSRSFAAAFMGIVTLFRSQVNARIHIGAMVLVLAAGFFFNISTTEWFAVLLCIGMVISMEAINTALEILCDKVEPHYNEAIGRIKDIAAAGVLISAIVAATIGVIVFLPKVVAWFEC